MPRITAEAANGIVAFEVEKDRKLVLCLEDNGVDILHRCGGNAKCTTCRVEILSGDPGEIGEPEKIILATKTDLGDHTRLSCQVRVIDDLQVKVIRQASVEGIDAGGRPSE
ncbi:MAG: (2Fe-2S)-binding protein [Acidobacteriota bacterium]|jgi:ferredoxin|nr:(2Fe-2S)-binding protein [Acidobacteriota bacterium]MDQ3373647.1 (2Fe-2S)-binding protein [Acidobacteriota bacterium]